MSKRYENDMKANVIHNEKNFARGSVLKYELDRQKVLHEFWPAIYKTPVQTGISQAHKQIVFNAKKEGLKEVLIMEDDVKFPSMDGFSYFLQNKPEDYDIYLGGVYSGSPDKEGLVKSFSGLHCYMVHSSFYDDFLSIDESKHLDRGMAGKGRFVLCDPMVAIQYNGFSENTNQIMNYDSYLVGKRILE